MLSASLAHPVHPKVAPPRHDRPGVDDAGTHPLACLIAPMLGRQAREHVLLLAFDRNGRLLSCHEADGSDRATWIDPRALRAVMADSAVTAVLLVHNHPSGIPCPSRADETATRRLADGLRLVGVALIDHLVWTDAAHFSFRAAGLL